MGMASISVAFYLLTPASSFLHTFGKDRLYVGVEISTIYCVFSHHGIASKSKKAFLNSTLLNGV